jgi:arylsulfatase A-like enzyme
VRRAPGEKFFLYAHYLDPHSPYEPATRHLAALGAKPHPQPLKLHGEVREHCSELRKQGFAPGEARFEDLKLRYDAEISATSDAIRTLVTGLEAMGVLDRTLIVITSDHGEEFLEHGYVEHAWTLYEESVHVPLLMWAPANLMPQRVDTGVSLVDLMPTLFAFFGLPAQAAGLDGRPLFNREKGRWSPISEETPRFSELLIQTRNLLHSVTLGEWKYIVAQKWLSDAMREQAVRTKRASALPTQNYPYTDPWGPAVREELYNLATDPAESRNLADRNTAQLERMRSLMAAYREKAAIVPATPLRSLGFSVEELRELEILGYH